MHPFSSLVFTLTFCSRASDPTSGETGRIIIQSSHLTWQCTVVGSIRIVKWAPHRCACANGPSELWRDKIAWQNDVSLLHPVYGALDRYIGGRGEASP